MKAIEILNNIRSQTGIIAMFLTGSCEACVKPSDRWYDRPAVADKAIDVLDEVGARKHIKNINVPQTILDLEKRSGISNWEKIKW